MEKNNITLNINSSEQNKEAVGSAQTTPVKPIVRKIFL
jgi:hypothetical protein